jgi:hypothetical protein
MTVTAGGRDAVSERTRPTGRRDRHTAARFVRVVSEKNSRKQVIRS